MSGYLKATALVLALLLGCARDDMESDQQTGESATVSEQHDELLFIDGGVGPWPAQYGTRAQEFTYGLAVDAQGNAFVTSSTYAAGPNAGQGDIFTMKYSASGGPRWLDFQGTSSPDIPHGAAVDPDGNLVIAGQTYGALQGLYAGAGDVFIIKFNTNGQKQWTMQYGTTAFDSVHDLTIDASGNMLVVGTTGGPLHGNNAGGTDIFVVKFGPNRAAQWVKQFGTSGDDDGRAVAIDSAGNVYVAGTTAQALDGNAHLGGKDAFVTKYNVSGQKQWTRQLGSVANDEGHAVACDASGNAYVAGFSAGSVDGNTSAGNLDGFVAKYDAAGVKQWTRQFGSSGEERLESARVDANGNLYLAGRAAAGFDGQAGAGRSDAFLVKYSGSGAKQWTRLFGSSNDDEGNAIAIQGNAILMAGGTYGTIPGRTSAGDRDLFVVRYDAAGALLP